MPFLGGYLIDKIGIRISLTILAVIQIIGQGILTLGAYNLSFNTMLVGRVIFGMASETQTFAQVTFITHWFKAELNFGCGVICFISLTGAVLNGYLSPKIYGSSADPHL